MMVCGGPPACTVTGVGAEPNGGSGAAGGRRPRGDPNLAPRCGAKTRAGPACQSPGMANGRCRIHGGNSTGPRTAKGLASLAAAHTKGGAYTAANRARQRYVRKAALRLRLFTTALDLRAYMPPDVAARLATVPAELSAPVHYSQTPDPQFPTETLWSGGRDARGRFMARPRPAPRGRAAELRDARVDRAALVPWRAAIAAAKLVKRAVLAARRAARTAEPDKDPMERRPGGCLGGRAAGIAAATGVVGAAAAGVRLPGQGHGPKRGDQPGQGNTPGRDCGLGLEDAPAPGGGRTPEVGRAEVGGGPGSGEFLQRPHGAGLGAGLAATVPATEVLPGLTGGGVARRMPGQTPGTSGLGQSLPAMAKGSPAGTRDGPGMANGDAVTANAAPGLANASSALANAPPAMAKGAPGTEKNATADKDLMKRPAVRWPLGGRKGRLCGSTTRFVRRGPC